MNASRRLMGLACCAALAACAKLGGFEDFSPGASTGGTSSSASGSDMGGTDSPTAGTAAGVGEAGSISRSGAGAGGGSAGSGPNVTAGSPGVGGGGEGGDGSPPLVGGAPSLLDDCVLLMHFEEASWSMEPGEVKDSSGLANHGTASASSITTSGPAEGKFGRAAKLDGAGAVVVPDSASLRPGAALTISAWIYPTTITSNGPGIVSKRVGFGSDTAFALFLYDSPATLYADVQGEDDRFHGSVALLTNVWHHVALVYDGTLPQAERSRLYVDGELDAVGGDHATQIEPYTPDLWIGDLPSGGERFIGLIDEVAIWKRALGATEIQEVYSAPAGL